VSPVLERAALGPALQMCLTSAKERERIAALNLLAMIFPRQPRMLLALFTAGALLLAADSCVRFPGANPDRSIFYCWKKGNILTHFLMLKYLKLENLEHFMQNTPQ